MAVLAADPWVANWQIHQDLDDILKGVEALRFTLQRVSAANARPEYKMIYDPSNLSDDPFADTKFVQFGKDFPLPPNEKLEPWTKDEEPRYLEALKYAFSSPSANTRRLEGEKEFGGKKEALTIYLLPEAVRNNGSGPRFLSLLYFTCRKKCPSEFIKDFSAEEIKKIFQDGTAHGNPK